MSFEELKEVSEDLYESATTGPFIPLEEVSSNETERQQDIENFLANMVAKGYYQVVRKGKEETFKPTLKILRVYALVAAVHTIGQDLGQIKYKSLGKTLENVYNAVQKGFRFSDTFLSDPSIITNYSKSLERFKKERLSR